MLPGQWYCRICFSVRWKSCRSFIHAPGALLGEMRTSRECLLAVRARVAREPETHSVDRISRSETSAPPPWKPDRDLSLRLAVHPWSACASPQPLEFALLQHTEKFGLQFQWNFSISSRNTVPRLASSNRPMRWAMAPVNALFVAEEFALQQPVEWRAIQFHERV